MGGFDGEFALPVGVDGGLSSAEDANISVHDFFFRPISLKRAKLVGPDLIFSPLFALFAFRSKLWDICLSMYRTRQVFIP